MKKAKEKVTAESKMLDILGKAATIGITRQSSFSQI
jgi:hypothetical protein